MAISELVRKHSRLLLLPWILFLFNAPVLGQTVTLDQSASGDVKEGTSVSFSHSVSAGNSNRLVVVSIIVKEANIQTVTYGGVAMTFEHQVTYDGRTLAVYYLASPAEGSNTVSVTASKETNLSVGAVGYYNVDQTSPFTNLQGEAGQSSGITKNIDCDADDLVVDFLASDDDGAVPGQTLIFEDPNPSGEEALYNSYDTAGAGTEQLSWTWSDAEYNYIWACMNAAPPTAAVIGAVSVGSEDVTDILKIFEADDLPNDVLLSLLAIYGSSAMASDVPDNREAILDALNTNLDPDGDGRVALVTWTTLSERGTVGFFVERRQLAQPDRSWHPVSEKMLPGLIDAPLGGEYVLWDPSVRTGETHEYRLVEQEAWGTRKIHGPWRLSVE